MLSEICRRQCCRFDAGRGFFCRGEEVSISWRPRGLRTFVVRRGREVERSMVCISGMGGTDG